MEREMEKELEDEVSRWREERYRERLSRIGIPTRYADATDARAEELAERLVSGGATGLYVYGDVGSGKTWLACSVLRRAARRERYQPRAFGAVSMLSSLRASYDGKQGVTVEELERADMLLVDDLDKPRFTPWALETLYEVVNARVENGRPTIVTANSDMGGLVERLSAGDPVLAEAICDRLVGGAIAVRMDGESRRRWADA